MSNDSQKSRIALGVAVIALIFMLEVTTLNRNMPSPATPWVLGLLAAVAVCGTWAAWRWRKKPPARWD